MNVTLFVSVSSLLLALWLGITFVHEVPPLQNPNISKAASVSLRSARMHPAAESTPANAADSDPSLADNRWASPAAGTAPVQ